MKITFISYHTVSIRAGGALSQLQQTAAKLKNIDGIEVQYFNPWAPRDEALEADLFHFFSANFGVYDLARWLHENDKPFVVSPIFFTQRSPGIVRVTTNLDYFLRTFARGIWSDYGFAKDICHWAKWVLPNTQMESDLIRDGLNVNVEKLAVIPNGVEDRFAHADPELFKEEYGVDNFILNVGHIGRERKNTLSLIRALKDIDHPAVIIGLVHPSKESEACLKEAQANDNLVIIPGLPHDSPLLESAYAACKVFVLPSFYETPGIAALEAGLTDSEIVITPHGGTKDYFQDFAQYINPNSIPSIKRGIEIALSKKKSTLKDHIRKNFLWSNVASQTAEIYKNILGK